MIVVGARFRALAGARAALRAIRTSIGVASGDVGVRPLGGTRYEAPVEDFLLAGRFEDGDVPAVINVMHAHGGRVIERRRGRPRSNTHGVDSARVSEASAPSVTDANTWSVGRRGLGPIGRDRESRLQKRLRRPSARLRARTTLRHRIGADRQ